MKARQIPGAINLAFGEPHFGPHPGARERISSEALNWETFLSTCKKYEQSRGMKALREAIADYYARRYGMKVDPENEILITHGGVEAINLAALITCDPGDTILLTDPSYMLYQRALATLGRHPLALTRTPGEHEYAALEQASKDGFPKARAILVNSPENPTGYVMSQKDMAALSKIAQEHNLWVIHDEVYDSMAFARRHLPARSISGLENRTILINSFSKKYGMPGLRIGWLCGPAEAIDLAAKLHDFMYLGVNQFAETCALQLIRDETGDRWMDETAELLATRAQGLMNTLTPELGFEWLRSPMGAMFAFPSVTRLAKERRLTPTSNGLGDAVAHYLLGTKMIATIPGYVYGRSGQDCLRIITCSDADTFERGLKALASL
ncbi:MAG: pyridoxal phosphate-dependent aminotransferase [Alphaproteobacteria bacterium]|nr:pyridoxal phosphate-dependent aminotransferase [Alphaproteobacteria bacterium]